MIEEKLFITWKNDVIIFLLGGGIFGTKIEAPFYCLQYAIQKIDQFHLYH